jgi:hypothetical protein
MRVGSPLGPAREDVAVVAKRLAMKFEFNP